MAERSRTAGAALEVAVQRSVGGFRLDTKFVAEPGITVLFGHSGSGKSMTLRCISGLVRPDAGRIVLAGHTLFDSASRINVLSHRRGVGVVLQQNALFPHLSVRANIEFGLSGITSRVRQERVRSLLALLNLGGFEDRKPRTLSGGQQQRVALARALALENQVLLLDEPFSALDEGLRQDLREELLRLTRELHLTIVFVTHDLREAHLLADRVAVFDAGRVLQFDERESVFRRPSSRRVAELTGVRNIFRGRLLEGGDTGSLVEVEGLVLRCSANPAGAQRGDIVDVCIRSERVNLRRTEPDRAAGGNQFAAMVTEEFAYGSTHSLQFRPLGAGPAVDSELAARPYEVLGVASRKQWTLELPAGDLHVMPAG
jgi:molybdate transport system ATP-binding protein